VPRKKIELDHKVEYLQILDEKGNVDQALEPKLDGDQLLKMYRFMLMTRRLDERLLNMQRQGRIGTYAPIRGQEAVQIGSALALRDSDWLVQAFREPGCCLVRGWSVKKIIQFWGGYEEGCAVPEGVNDTPIAVPVASQCPHIMGIAWGMKMKGVDDVAIGYCGDGGTSEGDFHEALTFAGVFKVPAIFIITNNQWAISVPRHKQTASPTLAQKALAYGMDGLQIDGNDILAMYVATEEAIVKARSGGGPSLIEAVTYRLAMHTTADDPKKYRDDAEVARWEKRDPLPRFEKYLRAKDVLDDKTVAELESDIKDFLKAGVEEYEASRDVDPRDCFKYMYNELPAELKAQAEEFNAALEREGVGVGH
jgi:pyruvate dehydrogenase E1 component alpha subunit